ncbi:MAG TPA: type I-B CRISPR-associated protein Cas5b [Spirochaetota bacterium]|jgi:CRISPR-associated protein Cas5t|nr:type I-B CRISPR-associated protein Cas5b [Spirochaetota bacterium]
MAVLRLIIYQPQAHYRIPFTFQRRHTYPIPPYSTVLGFLCNACGIDDQNNELYSIIKELKISISGFFDSKTTEMIWFRNLSKKAHEDTYGAISEREKNGQVGHIGGQSPMGIDVLDNVELVIYLHHSQKTKLELLKNLLERPVDRLQVLHIGRSEDWIVYRDITLLEDSDLEYKRQDGYYPYFFWIPKRIFSLNGKQVCWDSFDGIPYIVTTFSNIENYEQHHNHTGKRIYKRIEAKLNDGRIINAECFFDKTRNIPVFLGELNGR